MESSHPFATLLGMDTRSVSSSHVATRRTLLAYASGIGSVADAVALARVTGGIILKGRKGRGLARDLLRSGAEAGLAVWWDPAEYEPGAPRGDERQLLLLGDRVETSLAIQTELGVTGLLSPASVIIDAGDFATLERELENGRRFAELAG